MSARVMSCLCIGTRNESPMDHRIHEIGRAVVACAGQPVPPPLVVPVRMMEAWLLFDGAAIRRAAGNPNGDTPSIPPNSAVWRNCPGPGKRFSTLCCGRPVGCEETVKSLRVPVRRVADLIDDFAPLRHLSAFQRLEQGCMHLREGDNIRTQRSEEDEPAQPVPCTESFSARLRIDVRVLALGRFDDGDLLADVLRRDLQRGALGQRAVEHRVEGRRHRLEVALALRGAPFLVSATPARRCSRQASRRPSGWAWW